MLEVLNHPLITHKLTQMRKTKTGTKDFRENLDEIAELMAYEVCRDLPVQPVEIETPVAPCVGYELSKEVIIVPILRAGIGLLDGIRRLVPTANHIAVEIIYNKECEAKQDNNRYASIDLGLDNLCTLTSNATQSIILNGKPLKSINQHYNKTKAKLQSKLSNNKHTSKRINRLTIRRNRKIKDYMHKINTLCIKLTICIK